MDKKRHHKGTKETAKQLRAYTDYLAMGQERSLPKLWERYKAEPKAAPTTRLTTLKQWSSRFNWQARVLEQEQKHNDRVSDSIVDERVRQKRMRSERIEKMHKLWLASMESMDPTDAKYADMIATMRTINEESRKEFDEEPTKRVELSGPGGGPVESLHITAVTDLEKVREALADSGIDGVTDESGDGISAEGETP